METKRFIELLDKFFLTKIRQIPNWGKNQVENCYKEAKAEAAIQLLQEMQEVKK